MPQTRLHKLFAPRSVAIAGASARPGSLGQAVLRNMREAGFKGAILPVNPRHREVDGLACAPSIAAMASVPDVVVIAAPKDSVLGLAEEAAARGVPACIVVTADPDHGPDSLKARLGALARRTGMRIVGPNCLGVMAPRASFNASFAASQVAAGDLAVISQSGAVAAALIDWLRANGLGLSGLVSLGAMADVNFADLLDHYALDPATRAIILYFEIFVVVPGALGIAAYLHRRLVGDQ